MPIFTALFLTIIVWDSAAGQDGSWKEHFAVGPPDDRCAKSMLDETALFAIAERAHLIKPSENGRWWAMFLPFEPSELSSELARWKGKSGVAGLADYSCVWRIEAVQFATDVDMPRGRVYVPDIPPSDLGSLACRKLIGSGALPVTVCLPL